jgi:dual specificity protein kinase YAK1
MLESGKQVDKFFIVYFDEYGRKHWRLKSIDEYERDDPSVKEQPSKKFFAANTLPEIIKTYPNQRKGLKQADVDRGASGSRRQFQVFANTAKTRRNGEPGIIH